MNKLLKQINDIQSQLNALQGDLINLLPAITFAEEMFSSRGLSDEETCSDVPSKPEAENICVSSKLLKAKEEMSGGSQTLLAVPARAETKSVTKRKKLQAKAEPAPEPAPELTLQQSAEARSIADPTDEQQAEVIANTQRLIDETMELVVEKKAEKAETPPKQVESVSNAPQSQEGSALSYDDFKNAIYTFIKENTATNKPIVLGIFKERGYGFTSDVPETDYQLVLNLIKERG